MTRSTFSTLLELAGIVTTAVGLSLVCIWAAVVFSGIALVVLGYLIGDTDDESEGAES